VQSLRNYTYEIDEKTGLWSKTPLHDIHSHGADSFRQFAVSIDEVDNATIKLKLPQPDAIPLKLSAPRSGLGWLRGR
jgi:phage terminase large subunit